VKVFLLGGFGFIGKRFIRKFSKEHEIIVYATKDDISEAKKTLDLENVKIEEGFIEDENLKTAIQKHNPDVVIQLAALTGIEKCRLNPLLAFKINVFGTFNSLESCVNSSTKFIFISSREVYGDTLKESSGEDDPLSPNNVYGITKLIGENLVQMAGLKHGLDYTILRLTNVYGPEGDQYGPQKMIRNALEEKKIKILGGKQTLNFVYVDDMVDVLNSLLSEEKSHQEIFNVGSEDTLTIEEFAKKVSKLMGGEISLEFDSMRETETTKFRPNNSKLKKLIKFSLTPFDVGLKNTIEWYQEKN